MSGVKFEIEHDFDVFDIIDTISESLSEFGLEIICSEDGGDGFEIFEIRELD